MLAGILDASETADTQRQEDHVQARKAPTPCDTAINRLLERIEKGPMSAKDRVFAQRLAEQRGRKAALIETIAGLERQQMRGSKKITPETVARFGDMIIRKLQGDDPVLCQIVHVHLLVEKVKVTTTLIRILGSKSALEHAILDNRVATGRVPGFDREWCPWPDSNQHGFLHPILSRTRLPFHHRGTHLAISASASVFQRPVAVLH